MNAYVFLAVAIVSEVFGSSMMKLSNGFKRLAPSIAMVVGMGFSFYMLSLALHTIPLGTAYAIWSGVGTVLTTLVGVLLYKEKINAKKALGIILIVGGVVIMKLAAN